MLLAVMDPEVVLAVSEPRVSARDPLSVDIDRLGSIVLAAQSSPVQHEVGNSIL